MSMDSDTKLCNSYTTRSNEMKTTGENMKYIKHIYLLRVNPCDINLWG